MPTTSNVSIARVLTLVFLSACASGSVQRADEPAPYDVIIRNGTLLDGTGAARYRGDVAIAGDRIARIGNLSGSKAATEIDATGLFVTPGFINIHSHATPAGLPTAVNMLTQGVTTEILNPDGGGPLDLAAQRATLTAAGLAVNIGAYIGFNSIWASVVGMSDRRPTPADVDSMRKVLVRGLEQGAFGISAGLDYKPGYFATTDEVVSVVEAARGWNTNFTNHDRLTPETGYSSRVGMEETMQIGQRAGLVPVITHMKLQGHEQRTADRFLAYMRSETERGHYVAADAYPYLAGQTALYALFVPGWAQDGGREKMVARFRDPALRARIQKETDEAIAARMGGPDAIYLPASRRQLVDIMKEMQVTSGGEAIMRILETESPSMIGRFGAEEDLVKLLQYPATSVACDCGSAPVGVPTHPRYAGTFPRVLGHYVRETKALTWENAVRKMTGLPASTVGLVDRGFLRVGQAADITVFDTATVIDHATYEEPAKPSEGIRFVLVNGKLTLRDGAPTGVRAGRALVRTKEMKSRAMEVPRADGDQR